MEDYDLKKILGKKSSLGIIIVAGLVWDVVITLSIFVVVDIIKFGAVVTHSDSNILTTYLDLISNIGIIVIFILWFIYAIASIIKFIKSEIIPEAKVTKEEEINTHESTPIIRHTSGFPS